MIGCCKKSNYGNGSKFVNSDMPVMIAPKLPNNPKHMVMDLVCNSHHLTSGPPTSICSIVRSHFENISCNDILIFISDFLHGILSNLIIARLLPTGVEPGLCRGI